MPEQKPGHDIDDHRSVKPCSTKFFLASGRTVRPPRQTRARHAHSGDHRHPALRQSKTTGAALPGNAGRRNTAVIVNEFGSTGIDDALVRSSTGETVLLGNGCICNTRSDLAVALRKLLMDRQRGDVPAFEES